MTVKVKLEDNIIVKRSVHGPDFLVSQFVLRPGCVATESQALGLAVGKSQSQPLSSYVDIPVGTPWVGSTEYCPR